MKLQLKYRLPAMLLALTIAWSMAACGAVTKTETTQGTDILTQKEPLPTTEPGAETLPTSEQDTVPETTGYEEQTEPGELNGEQQPVEEQKSPGKTPATGETTPTLSETTLTPGETTPTEPDEEEKIEEEIIPQYDLRGKTIVNFGDSIFGHHRPPNDISSFIEELTGATVYNVAFGGCRMSATHRTTQYDAFSMVGLAEAIASGQWSRQDAALRYFQGNGSGPRYISEPLAVLRSIDFSKVDIITIAYGTNDFASDVSLSAYEAALRQSIRAIRGRYPHIQIVLCTQIYRYWTDKETGELIDSDTQTFSGQTLTDFVQKTKEIAGAYGLLCIDNYYGSGINKNNREDCFNGTDYTHPNAYGRHLIAHYVARRLYERFG